MKHDPFDFRHDMTWQDRAWRIAFLVVLIGILTADLFYWRPL